METLATSEIPEVIACQGGPGAEDVPPNKTGTTPNSPVFDTPEKALVDLLSTEVAGTWPKRGYFELVTPDGTVVYANPYDDMSPDPARQRTRHLGHRRRRRRRMDCDGMGDERVLIDSCREQTGTCDK